jgi:transcriptional regulator with XRE-family HTH domain
MAAPENAADTTRADTYAISLGRAIMVARTAVAWSRRDLAQRAGISYPYLGHIETGRQFPSSPVLVRISEALDLRPSDLLARAEGRASAGTRSRAGDFVPTVSGELPGPGGTPQASHGEDLEDVFMELHELVNRMSPGDRERLIDLARRLAH